MAKSKARKKREKLIREGRTNPNTLRSSFASSEMYKLLQSKVTSTKKEKLNKLSQKHKKRLSHHVDGRDNRSLHFFIAS